MDLIRFSARGREMVGVLHTPTGQPQQEAVLLCNPFGQEAIRSHRLFRVVAERLARQGCHVMRFDYFATGDSAGDDGEGDIDGWLGDILAADEELRRRSGSLRITWLGLRLGASMAALASRRSGYPLHRLVLWDPIVDGSAYLNELAEAHINACRSSFGVRWQIEPGLRARVMREADSEALGFSLPPRLREQIGELSPPEVAAARAEHIALLAEPGLPGLDALSRYAAQPGRSFSTQTSDTKIDWTTNEATDSSIVPPGSLKALLSLVKKEES